MGLAIDCRSDLSELQAKNPDSFDKFNRLRIEIDSPLTKIPGEFYQSTVEDSRRRRVQATREIDETLACIRKLPGFKRFQLPPRSEDLVKMAVEGPIVIFNTTELRSDAIIVTSSGIESLVLPRLVLSSVKNRVR